MRRILRVYRGGKGYRGWSCNTCWTYFPHLGGPRRTFMLFLAHKVLFRHALHEPGKPRQVTVTHRSVGGSYTEGASNYSYSIRNQP